MLVAGLGGPCARGLGAVGTGSRAHGTHTEGTGSPGTHGFGRFLGDLGSKWMDLVAGVEVGVGGGMKDEGTAEETHWKGRAHGPPRNSRVQFTISAITSTSGVRF